MLRNIPDIVARLIAVRSSADDLRRSVSVERDEYDTLSWIKNQLSEIIGELEYDKMDDHEHRANNT